MNNRRSASVGALPAEKKHFVSRNESVSGVLLDVRCACQYFQCDSLLPERVNPVESRPTSKLGFAGDHEHGEHQHFDNVSTRSFNMPSKRPEFDRISAASFGGQMHGADGRGLVVRSISDATDPEMPPMGAPVGHRGRQMSIGGISSGSFGGRDPDAVSIRSGISLRRISRSPSRADLFVADLNIPTPHMPGQSRRSSRGEMPRFNVIAPTPTPAIGNMSPPDFNIYDRKTIGRAQPNRWTDDNKENLRGHHERLLPQNKPIDLSRYQRRDEYGKLANEPMDVDIEPVEAVVDIRDNIRIDRMSPPLEENVPDLSPVVKDETKIEITNFAPPKVDPFEEVLADEASSPQFSHLKRQHAQERTSSPDYSKKQFMRASSPTAPSSFHGGQQMDARQLMHCDGRSDRAMGRVPEKSSSPGYSENQFMRASSPTAPSYSQRASSPAPEFTNRVHGGQQMDARQRMHFDGRSDRAMGRVPEKSSSPGYSENQFMRASSPTAPSYSQRASSPAPEFTNRAHSGQQMDARQRMHFDGRSDRAMGRVPEKSSSPGYSGNQFMRASSPAAPSSSQRASSPAPEYTNRAHGRQQMEARQLMHYDGPPNQSMVRTQEMTSSSDYSKKQFMRASSPSAPSSSQRASPSAPEYTDQRDARQLMHYGGSPSKPMARASSPVPTSTQTRQVSPQATVPSQSFQRASSPSPAGVQTSRIDDGTNITYRYGCIESTEKPREDKQSYSSRFMSMFHSKPSEQMDRLQTPPQEKRKPSISQLLHIDRGRSPSPSKKYKPEQSPTSSRFMSVFKKQEVPTAMSVIEGTHAANVKIHKPAEEKPLTVKVTETFSLKVDEMDQYSSRPPRSPSSARQSRRYASSDQLGLIQERLSGSMDFYGDRNEPFAPVIVNTPRLSQTNLQAGDRSQYLSSSQADLRSSRHFDSHEYIPQQPHPLTFNTSNRKLVSVPIANPDLYDTKIITSEFVHQEYKEHPSYSQPSTSNFVKSPSEQRLAQSKLLQQKTRTSDRTQSQDRATADHLSELDNFSISTRSMTKTVSFSLSDRDSRLSQRAKTLSSSHNQLERDQWLERTYFSRDHEYEPIGQPPASAQKQATTEQPLVSVLKKEPSPAPPAQEVPKLEISQPSIETPHEEEPPKTDDIQEVEELQKDLEERYFSSEATTPRTESRTDYDHTSQVDSSALEELPLKPENRKKGFMASAQDRTRKMQAGLKNQAGKIKTKLRTTKKPPSGSPKAQARKRFKAPEFSKIKMPEIKRPDLSGFKRPEFTKFSKPDMSKFKLPDKFSSLKLTRSKSFKEPDEVEETTISGTTPESTPAPAATPSKKPKFDFSFGTYPRAFRKKKKPQEEEEVVVDERSVIPSTETQPSAESSSTPQGDRGPGPVRSRWADKFSDVSYNDSEGSRYPRYGSEQESSFDRESSMERRMREVQEENAREEAELSILGVVEQKQFADFDEENRAIHEISKTREREFKRRPIVHQDSDLVSEEGKDIGWTEREAEKNRILLKAELEAEERLRFLAEKQQNQDGQSSTSSKKFAMDEPNEVIFKTLGDLYSSKERKYLERSLEESLNQTPSALQMIGSLSDGLHDSSMDQIDYGHDHEIPPPKPRRLSHQQRRRPYDSENNSQVVDFSDDISLSHGGSDYRQIPPSRPLRKGRFKHSQEISIGEASSLQYDDEHYFDRPDHDKVVPDEDDFDKENVVQDVRDESPIPPPQAPRRRRKKLRDSVDKDSFINGFGGRSVSNSYLKEDNKPEEVIVFRTEHEYKIPLATPENYTDTSATPHISRSLSRLGPDEDDHTSRGADSLALDMAVRGENKNLADDEELHEKYIIEMMENDGYAVVRKENLPKPTPPARRKKFTRSPGERFATMPHLRRASPVMSDEKPSTRIYNATGRPTPPRRRSAQSLGIDSQKDFENDDISDYEIPELDGRTDSPRNLQSGDIINKMKYRPLPPPPRPPREKRHFQRDRHGDEDDQFESRDDQDDRDGGGERIVYDDSHAESSDDYNQHRAADKSIEVEVSTQTDPLPDDFVCEEFEITEDMKIIEPRRTKTLDEILREEEEAELERARQIDEEVLLRGIQRFREANQRSISEKSRASSQAKSLSRPQTPSAILIEKRVPTPVPNSNGQTVLEASLTVQPIDDLDLEEELLRREGLYDGSHSKSDAESHQQEAGHESEEENAKVGEESSYTRSTDAESQQHEDDELERILQEKQRLQEQLIEAQRIREEEEEQKLDEIRRLLEEDARQRKQAEEFERQQWLQQESRLKEQDSYDDKPDERLKPEDSYKQKSEVSEEKDLSPPVVSSPPPLSQQPTVVEEQISILHGQNLLSEPQIPPRARREEPEAELLSPQPTVPPRKRSSAAVSPEHQFEPLSLAEQQSSTAPIPVSVSHHALPELEVERLRVHALQAGQIMVSQLHGAQLQADEFECRSGNLVVRNIELPPGLIEEIVDRVRSTEREHSQAGTQTIAEVKTQTEGSITPPPIPTRETDIPPVRPPPPQQESIFPPEYVQALQSRVPFSQPRDVSEPPLLPRGVTPTDYMQSVPPVGFYAYRYHDDDEEPPVPVYRRRRHHRRRDSSSDEDHQHRRSRSTRPEPQTITQAGRQFISACSLPLINAINHLTNAMRPNADNKNDQVQPRHISAVVALFIVVTLSLILYLLTGRNIHHHHWDYFNPPGNDGRLS